MLRHLSYGLSASRFFDIPCFIVFELQVVSLFHTVLWYISNWLSASEFSDLYGYYGRCMRVLILLCLTDLLLLRGFGGGWWALYLTQRRFEGIHALLQLHRLCKHAGATWKCSVLA